MDKDTFYEIVKKNQIKNNIYKDGFLSFLGGGLLGILSQGLVDIYSLSLGLDIQMAFSLSSITIVFIVATLTSLGLYNNLGQIFGAGLFIPISGFSNSMVSASLEGRSEGPIYGIGSRIFSLAGSVIIYGIVSSFLCAVGYYLLLLMGVVS